MTVLGDGNPLEFHARDMTSMTYLAPYDLPAEEREALISSLEREMWKAVERLDFEKAAEIRDLISALRGGGDITGEKDKKDNMATFSKHKIDNRRIHSI